MYPTINLKATGINLRRIMDQKNMTPKDVQEYLKLESVQSVYNWCNGINMPSIDNLYALSSLFGIPIDSMICGNRKYIGLTPSERRIMIFCEKMCKLFAA